jgi:hypothetical protein
MTNVKAVDPDKAWGLFQGWAAQALRREAPGTTLTLVDYPALRRPRAEPPPAVHGPTLYPIGYLQGRRHEVLPLRQGLWRVDGIVRTTFQLVDMINQHRRDEGLPEVGIEDLKGIDR